MVADSPRDTNEDAARLLDFIDACPSPFHACAEIASRLDAAGFTRLEESAGWTADDVAAAYVVRGGSLVAWKAGHRPPETGIRLVGAHTDSPNLRVKLKPDRSVVGFRQLGVEIYGGVLLNSWLDRDLGLSGRVTVRDGSQVTEHLLLVDRPMMRVPQLAIHLHREIRDEGLHLNPQEHMAPIWGLGELDEGGFVRFLAAELGVDAEAIDAWDVMAHDFQPGAVVGPDGEFLCVGRLDNLMSCFAGLDGLLRVPDDAEHVAMLCLFDHEEIGSTSDRGAASAMLPAVIERIVAARGGDRETHHRAIAASVCLSADNAHATHPNYPDKHEPEHLVVLNGGPVLKANANVRYASDAASTSAFLAACEAADVPVQRYIHRNDLPCGSTIGPITAANLGISTVDVGAPQLSMHSAREITGSQDPEYYRRAITAFLSG